MKIVKNALLLNISNKHIKLQTSPFSLEVSPVLTFRCLNLWGTYLLNVLPFKTVPVSKVENDLVSFLKLSLGSRDVKLPFNNDLSASFKVRLFVRWPVENKDEV